MSSRKLGFKLLKAERALPLVAVAHLFIASATACPCAFDPTGPYTAAANAAMQSKNYTGALSFLQQALKLDGHNPNIIYNIALMHLALGNYQEAEANMIKSIEELSSNYGSAHRQVAQGYMDLGDLYENEAYEFKKPELKKKAEECYLKSIALCEEIYTDVSGASATKAVAKSSPSKHKSKKICEIDLKQAKIDLSNVLRHTADFHNTDENVDQAAPLYTRSLELEQSASGADDIAVCKHKADLGEFFCESSKPELAEPLFKEALASLEKNDQINNREGVKLLYKFGNLYRDQDKLDQAELMLKRSVDVLNQLTLDEQDLAEKTVALADVLDKRGKTAEAEKLCDNLVSKLENSENKQALLIALKQYHKHYLMQRNKVEAEKVSGKIKSVTAQLKTAE